VSRGIVTVLSRAAPAIALAAVTVFASPPASLAQPATKIARVGYLGTNVLANPGADARLEALRRGLRDLGYVEGRSLVIEYRNAAGNADRYPALVAELMALEVDVIVAPPTPAALAAKRATSSVPVIFIGAADPVNDGLVASLARPGGNVTALSVIAPELTGKRLEQLKHAVPAVSRVGVLWNPGGSGGRTEAEVLQASDTAARGLGLQLKYVETRTADGIDKAFVEIVRARAGAVMVLGSVLLFNERKRIADLALKHRLPSAYPTSPYVEAGGLMSYGPDFEDVFRRAATYVDKILKGARPGDLPSSNLPSSRW
jgi:putative ABC transport system substrate-binding protein